MSAIRKVQAASILAVAMLAYGCDEDKIESEMIRVITLDDPAGLQCVVWRTYKQSGISCDWAAFHP